MDLPIDMRIRRPTAVDSDDFALLKSTLNSAKIIAVDVYRKGIDKGWESDHLQIATQVASVTHVFHLDFNLFRLHEVSILISNILMDSKVLKLGQRFSTDFASFSRAMRAIDSAYNFRFAGVKPLFRTSILPKYFDASHVEEKLTKIIIPPHELQHISSSITTSNNRDKIIAVANSHFILEMFANNFPERFGDQDVMFAYFAHPQLNDSGDVYLGKYHYGLWNILAVFVEDWSESISVPGFNNNKRKLEEIASSFLPPSYQEGVTFIADDMLNGLAKELRSMGVDVEKFPPRNHRGQQGKRKYYEKELISSANSRNKIILTCTKRLWKRDQMQVERDSGQPSKNTPRVYLLKHEDIKSHFSKVVEHFKLDQKRHQVLPDAQTATSSI